MWKCLTCGAEHDETPLCFGAEAPWPALVPREEFDDRVELTQDLCVVDGKTFFIRGHIEIPIVGRADVFSWSAWCSLSETSFRDCMARWHDSDRIGDTHFGWLCTALPLYPSTLHLKANVRSREVGVVPSIEIQPCDHPLYSDQQNGLSWKRIEAMVHELLHESGG